MGALSETLAEPGRLLRAEGRHAIGRHDVAVASLVAIVVVGSALYGSVMGALGGRAQGALYSAAKLPLFVVLATCLCLPCFHVVNALLGLSADSGAARRAILSAQGTLALSLAGLAPVTALFYASGLTYPAALLANALAFASSAVAAQRMLVRHYRPLVARDRRHRRALVAWFLLHGFVATKLAWVLRPFVGDPALPTTFLRAGLWHEDPYTNLFWAAVGLGVRALRAIGVG